MSILRRITVAIVPHARALPLTLAIVAVAIVPAAPAAPARAQGPQEPEWVAPARAASRANHLPSTTDAVKRGFDLFVRECAQCHGKAGHGDGPKASSLSPRPVDLASQRVQSQSDGALFWKLSQGRGLMPRAVMSDKDKWAVVNFLRSLAERQ